MSVEEPPQRTNADQDSLGGNAKTMIIMGGNPAEAHPVSIQHVLFGKERNKAHVTVIDPRFTRTAAKADIYSRIRSGTDIPFIWGLLYHIFKNGWEDKKYIADRVWGMEKVREEVLAKWTPDKVEEACGVPEARMFKLAKRAAAAATGSRKGPAGRQRPLPNPCSASTTTIDRSFATEGF